MAGAGAICRRGEAEIYAGVQKIIFVGRIYADTHKRAAQES